MKKNSFRPLFWLLCMAMFASACGVAEDDDGDDRRVDPPPACTHDCDPPPPACTHDCNPPVNPPPGEPTTFPAPFVFWNACDGDGACSASIGVHDFYANTAVGIELRFHRDPSFPATDTVSGPGPNLGGSLFLTKKENHYNIATWMCGDLVAGPHRATYLSSQQNDHAEGLAYAGYGNNTFMEGMDAEALHALYCTDADPDADISATGHRCDGLPVAVKFTDANGNAACKFVAGGNADTMFN